MVEVVGLARVRAVINDSLYGVIPVNEIEYSIIQTPVYNRLHEIRQLGSAHLVYPGAKHSRFEHSIGVMHLATRMLDNILSGMSPNELNELFTPTAYQKIMGLYERGYFKELGFHSHIDLLKAYLIQSIRLAGLLHDIGHYPYSHVIEEAFGSRGLHEKHTIDIILSWREFRNILKELKIPINRDSYTGLTSEHIASILVKESLRESVLNKNPYYYPLLTNKGYSLLHKIVSGFFDADRLDYLRRDALYTGIVYGLIDVDRIIENMYVTESNEDYTIYYDIKALPALEDMLDSRIKMYKLIYYHHKNVVLAEITRRMIKGALELESSGLRLVDEYSLKELFINKYVDIILKKPWILTDHVLYRIASSILDKVSPDNRTYYYARAFIDRRLLPFTLFKREEDLYNYITSIVGERIEFSEYKLIVKKIIDKIEYIDEREFVIDKYTIRFITSKIVYHGVSKPGVLIKVSGVLRNIDELSNYIKWIEKQYGDYMYVYIYAYTPDISSMKSYKTNTRLRRRFLSKALEVLLTIIKEDIL